MTPRSRLLIPAIRELGIADLFQYGIYQIGVRSGRLRRSTPLYRWSDRPLETWLSTETSLKHVLSDRQPFFFENSEAFKQRLQRFPSEDIRCEADEILAGKFRLFGGPPVDLGSPPDWSRIPLTGEQDTIPLEKHWTENESESGKDLRLLWEQARFGWAFTLCRAYQFTGEPRYAAGVLELLLSWMESNPPNHGPHWGSGQESALRILALTFAWYALEDYLEAAQADAAQILLALAVHAERIPPTISYARAQRNNHLLSEAVGLYSVGLLMPWFKQASEWKRLGRKWLIQALDDQVFDDGGYIQYSTNYQRLALSAGLWAVRLAEIHAEPLPAQTLGELRKMTQFLLSLCDEQNGTPPNWGHNDGSNILPLSSGLQNDYRPVLQAACWQLLGAPAFGSGAWDEMSLWLGVRDQGQDERVGAGREILAEAPVDSTRVQSLAAGVDLPEGGGEGRRSRLGDESGAAAAAETMATDFPDTGLYLMRGATSWAMLRSARFAARPAHSDQLHMDLWWNGQNIARDAGTYRYTASPPWENAFSSAAAHNTLTADGREPMDRAGRFLWLNWSDARYLGRWQAEDESVQALAAEHPLKGGLKHRRSVVQAGASMWIVLDELIGSGTSTEQHRARLAWSLVDWPWELDAQSLKLQGEQGPVQVRLTPGMDDIALYRAGKIVAGEKQPKEDSDVLGWWSPTYGYKEPALTLVATVEGSLPLRLTSWWRLGDVEPQDLVLELDNLQDDPLMAFLSSGR